MVKIAKTDREGNYLLEDINSSIIEEMEEMPISPVIITKEFQENWIRENICTFADASVRIKEILSLVNKTVTVINTVTLEEKEIEFEIEGGV